MHKVKQSPCRLLLFLSAFPRSFRKYLRIIALGGVYGEKSAKCDREIAI